MLGMTFEKSLVLIKPDAVERALVGQIIARIERCGLAIVGAKMVMPSKDQAQAHYREHVGKEFYPELEAFITRSPVWALVVEGRNSISVLRKLRGPTNPAEAPSGTVTGDFGHCLYNGQNLMHASANAKDAAREISVWFSPVELLRPSRLDAPAVGLE